jgi:hypothetical protein
MPAHGLSLSDVLEAIMRTEPWTRRWLSPLPGMVVCATPDRTFEARNLNIPMPPQLLALGCGGWNKEKQNVHWVGIDLDIGHGSQSYVSLPMAICAAMGLRQFVKGAAEIRLSKSGQGIHIRVALAEGVTGGRPVAACIAKWLARELELRADASPLGRQNFWFWARQPGPRGFRLVSPCEGAWSPPAEALREAAIVATPRVPVRVLPPVESLYRSLSRRTIEFIEHAAPEGQRNYRLFIAAADMSGSGFSEAETLQQLLPPALAAGLREDEIRATIRSAHSKPRVPARGFARLCDTQG